MEYAARCRQDQEQLACRRSRTDGTSFTLLLVSLSTAQSLVQKILRVAARNSAVFEWIRESIIISAVPEK